MPRTIDVGEILDRPRLGSFRLKVVSLCWLLAVLDGFDVQAMAFVAPVLMAEWGISKVTMGQLLTAGVIGMMCGSVLLGQVSDRIGRRPVLIGSVVLFGVGSLATALCNEVAQLLLARFATGIGLGGVAVAALALTVEYAPQSRRAAVVTAMYVGFPIGGGLGGLAAIPLLEAFGWQGVFVAGGVAPLLLIALVARQLPESLQYEAVSGRDPRRVAATLGRIAPEYVYSEGDSYLVRGPEARGGVGQLFIDGRAAGTVLLWIICGASLLVLYLLINWLPSLLAQSGFTLARSNLGAVAFNIGGVIGALALSRVLDRGRPVRVLTVSYGVAALVVCALPSVSGAAAATLLTILAGAGVIGSQLCMNSVVAAYYPTAIRSTGIGWALGVGRVGSVAGPLLGGVVLGTGAAPQTLFMVAAAPLVACAVAVALFERVHAHSAAAEVFVKQ